MAMLIMYMIRGGCRKRSPTNGAANRDTISATASNDRKLATSGVVYERSVKMKGIRMEKFSSPKMTSDMPIIMLT